MTPPGYSWVHSFWMGLLAPGAGVTGPRPSTVAGRLSRRVDGILIAVWVATLALIVLGANASEPVSAANAKFRLSGDRPLYLAAGACLLCLIVLVVPWARMGRDVQALPALGSILLLLPLQYHMLPWSHPHGVLVLLPVLCLAIRHRGRFLAIGLGMSAFGLWLPVIDGHRTYMDIVDHGVVFVSLVTLAGTTVYVLMERNRIQTRIIDALAHTDALTGLANRRGWDEQLPRMLAQAARNSCTFSVALIDLNLFKEFNDRLGHQAGDCLLREAARNWLCLIREQDLLSRWGGDEFALALPNCSRAAAAKSIGRLAAETPLAQTFCFGVAEWDGKESVDNLVARADAELYAAKRANKTARTHTNTAPGSVAATATVPAGAATPATR